MRYTARLGGIGLTVCLLGCSAAPGTVAEGDRVNLGLPPVISQLTHPTVALQDLPQTPVDSPVQVAGTVLQQAPLLESWLYQISDNTGTLWIKSPAPAPAIGATVQVQGLVQYEAIVVGNVDIGEYYLQETSRTLSGNPAEEEQPAPAPASTNPSE